MPQSVSVSRLAGHPRNSERRRKLTDGATAVAGTAQLVVCTTR